MKVLKENLLLQFSVVSLAVISIIAVAIGYVLTSSLSGNIDLLIEHGNAMMQGIPIKKSDPYSIPSLTENVSQLKWLIAWLLAVGFLVLYGGLLFIAWRKGWKTIIEQRGQVESANVEIGSNLEELSETNARLKRTNHELQSKTEQLEALVNISAIITEAGTFQQKAQKLVEGLACLAKSEWVTFRLLDENQKGLHLVAAAGPAVEALFPLQNLSATETLAWKAFHEGKDVVINDYPAEPNASPAILSLGMKSMILSPISTNGGGVGLINIVSREPGHFPVERVRLLTSVMSGLGPLIENAGLEEQRKQAEERMEETGRLAAIGELAAGVAHEINNPLASILGYAQLLSDQNLPASAQKDIKKIFNASQRASRIVKNLLFFAKKRGPDKQYLNVVSILERALDLKSYDFKKGNIEITCQLPQDLPHTMVDEHELLQVFINILSNGEYEMRAAHGGGHLVILATSADEKIKINITDDGPGIPAEHLDHIFEPFFTTKEVGNGTGLGLSICYGILRQHDGDLWAQSTPGDGATFHIELPVISPEALAEPCIPDLEDFLTSTRCVAKHLLVVDDEPDIRDLLADSFSLEQYSVDLASDGEEAWRKLQARPYDCILLDLKMPGMSGQQLFRRMDSANRNLAGRVIFITGHTASDDAHDFIASTGNPSLSKPFDLLELHQKVRQTLMRTAGVGQ